MVTTKLDNFKELQEKVTFEVLPLTTLSGLTFWFAVEIRHTTEPIILNIGPGCINHNDACDILKSFVED
jgi:hypothetical protein